MGNFLYLIVVFIIFSSSVNACDRCVHRAKTAYFSDPSRLSSGACGYGDKALYFLKYSHIAGAVQSLYKDGAACGACLQVRCTIPELCTTHGTIVIITDLNDSNQTDLVLGETAFRDMAKPIPGADSKLLKQGIVDTEYQRVPCDFGNANLLVRVEAASKKPNYLEIMFFHQGGQTEIVAVAIDRAGYSSTPWSYMRRSYGAVWGTDTVPIGALQFMLTVKDGYHNKVIRVKQSVLPDDWEADRVYDTGVQITEIAQESCDPCDGHIWM